jgi:hypothetical protein
MCGRLRTGWRDQVREGIIKKAEKMWAQIQEERFGREE